MSLPYLKHSNIYFVPILRQRLNFAVLVQWAIHDLRLDEEDLIAVALPESIAESVHKAIDKLPTVSFITTSIGGSDKREVFPVSPADGMIEAIRTARERGLPLRFIDQELLTGHLADRHCISYQDWPDDGLVLKRGAAWYFNLIQELLAHPPARFEPVDTWRERYMAEQLRRLHPLYRRILVVCHAGHINPIKNYLRDSIVLFDPGTERLPKTKVKMSEPGLAILLRYLEDMPKLVELYEQYRWKGNAWEFDKTQALIETIHHLDTTGFSFSIRHYQAFAQLLERLLKFEQRTSPDLKNVLLACESCFNKPFERRLYRHLISYYDQVKVASVVPVLDTKEELVELQTTLSDLDNSYVARSCDIVPATEFDIITLPRLTRTSFSDGVQYWPPWERYQEQMNSKAVKLANRTKVQSRSVQFQGSLHDGIDFRRTLRSQLGPIPKIYVKKHKTLKTQKSIGEEPVVWIFDMHADFEDDYIFSYAFQSYEKLSQYCNSLYWHKLLRTYEDFENCTLELFDIAGIVLFSIPYYEILADKDSKEAFEEQYLLQDDLFWDELYGHIPEDLVDEVDMGVPWWEILLLTGVRYAKETVVCVLPPEFIMPRRVIAMANKMGKRLERISLSQFTVEERQRLRNEYHIYSQYLPEPTKPTFDDVVWAGEMAKRFGNVMEQFWG